MTNKINSSSTLLNTDLDVLIEEILEKSEMPGAAISLYYKGQKTIKTYGIKKNNACDPITADTAFDVGSCSKAYVATAIAMLVSDGQINFDDPICKYIPEINLDTPEITQQITIRDLLCNRTGLKRQIPVESFANTNIRIVDILKRIGSLDRAHPFREGYVYFNPGFMANSLVVERISGLPYEDFLAQYLFQPLNMKHTASGLKIFDDLNDRAEGHCAQNRQPITEEIPVFDNWQGAAGIYTCATDVLKWIEFHLKKGRINNHQLIKSEILEEIYRPHNIIPDGECKLIHRPPEANSCHYGMGWWSTEFQGKRLVQHAGETFGWRAHIALLPDQDIGVSVMLNMAKGRHQVIAYSILETCLTGECRNWTDIAVDQEKISADKMTAVLNDIFPYDDQIGPSVALSDFAGIYSHPACGQVRVSLQEEKLKLEVMDGRVWDMLLTHLGNNVFQSDFIQPASSDFLPTSLRVRFNLHNGYPSQLQTIDTIFQRKNIT